MTLCVSCLEDLSTGATHACSQNATKKLGAGSQACKGKQGALVIHVIDGEGKDIKGVSVSLDGKAANTNKNGLDKHSSLKEKKYTVKLEALTGEFKKKYVPPDTVTQNVDVTNGQIAYVTFTLKQKVVVTPEIKLEYRVVLLDRKLVDKQHNDDKAEEARKIKPPDPTRIHLSMKQEPGDPKYTKDAKLTVSGAGKLEFYKKFSEAEGFKDEDKLDISQPIPNADLMGDQPLELFALGTTKGKLTLKLEPEDPADEKFVKPEAVEEEMGVVELKLKVHEQDLAAIDGIQIDPDAGTVKDYHKKLKDEKLPDQKELSDGDKLKEGRLLHVQQNDSHGRAKLIIEKLADGDWPDHTDDYEIVLAPKSGTNFLTIHDKEFKGKKEDPCKFTVKDLKKKEQELWIQGENAVTKLREGLLDLGLDRPAAIKKDDALQGMTKAPKHRGDMAAFTVVKIEEVKLDYTPVGGQAVAWDSGKKRFYINFQSDPDGRKVSILAKLSQKLEGIPLHFLLAENKDNREKANWGIDLPKTWKWQDITKDVKHEDKSDRKKLLHLTEKTDAEGEAKKELTLSRFGGDRFRPAAYINQDPHLAKYTEGHSDLEKLKPALATDDITVWRQFWYQLIEVDGVNNPGVAGAIGQYERIRSTMKAATAVQKTLAQAQGWNAIYPEYMIKVNGGTNNSLVITNLNKNNFFGGTGAEADKPIKVPILICDAQWDTGPATTPVTTGYINAGNYNIAVDRLVLKPALDGNDLLVAGTVKYRHPAPDGSWVTQPDEPLTDADLSIDQTRTSLRQVLVSMPATVAAHASNHPGTQINISGLRVQGAKGPYLGESFQKKVLAVYDPTEADDFQNTIAHEIGHGFGQTVKHGDQPDGVPNHPNQYISYDSDGVATGSHCNHKTNKCVMYQSGPIKGSLNRYCDVCHPYMLVNDLSTFT